MIACNLSGQRGQESTRKAMSKSSFPKAPKGFENEGRRMDRILPGGVTASAGLQACGPRHNLLFASLLHACGWPTEGADAAARTI